VKGWARDPSWPNDVITIEITAVDSAGNVTQLAPGWPANLPGPAGNHSFDVPISMPGTAAIHVRFSDTNKGADAQSSNAFVPVTAVSGLASIRDQLRRLEEKLA